jgi:hypothetical protein
MKVLSIINKLEQKIEKVFEVFPKLSKENQTMLLKFLPWLVLIIALGTLGAGIELLRSIDKVNSVVRSIQRDGYGAENENKVTISAWLSLTALFSESLLLFSAYPGTRDHKKSGWNLIFYAFIVNIFYGIVSFFAYYGRIFELVSNLIVSGFIFYFLFQIKSYFKNRRLSAKKS